MDRWNDLRHIAHICTRAAHPAEADVAIGKHPAKLFGIAHVLIEELEIRAELDVGRAAGAELEGCSRC